MRSIFYNTQLIFGRKHYRSVSTHSLFECLRTWPALGTSLSILTVDPIYKKKIALGNNFGRSSL